jgi:hypothetical protein
MATADDPDDRPARREYDDRPHYEEPHRGTLLLVLGILSIVTCPILGPFAWIMGNNDLKAMDEGRMDPEGKSNTNVGKILGIVGSVLLVINFLAIGAWVVIFGIVMAAAPAPGPKMAPNNPAPVFKQMN